uniref:F-box domain-containing protein n=1 Tax=Leersia perrieri TaxID=77586 RepID=A0A0D9XKT3_9ORYZ
MRTGTCVEFAVDISVVSVSGAGGGASPEIVFRPDDHESTAGDHDDTRHPSIGLHEESLVTVGPTVEETVFSSPATRAWADVLKFLPARTVANLTAVCRSWRAIAATDRFIRSHAIHANTAKATPPRVRFVMDPVGDLPVDVDVADEIHDPDISPMAFVVSQPVHSLNVGCFSDNIDFICNPIMDYHEVLPLNNDDVDTDDDGEYDDCNIFRSRIALGFDEDEGDHVAARLAYTANRSYEMSCRMRYVRRHEWSPTSPPPPPRRPVASDSTLAFANGKIYWLVDPALVAESSSTTTISLVSLDCRDAVASCGAHLSVAAASPS